MFINITFESLSSITKLPKHFITKEPNNEIKIKNKKKNQSDPFLLHVVGSGEEIKQQWGGRQAAVKAKQISR